jgi:hypothetical protein
LIGSGIQSFIRSLMKLTTATINTNNRLRG